MKTGISCFPVWLFQFFNSGYMNCYGKNILTLYCLFWAMTALMRLAYNVFLAHKDNKNIFLASRIPGTTWMKYYTTQPGAYVSIFIYKSIECISFQRMTETRHLKLANKTVFLLLNNMLINIIMQATNAGVSLQHSYCIKQ